MGRVNLGDERYKSLHVNSDACIETNQMRTGQKDAGSKHLRMRLIGELTVEIGKTYMARPICLTARFAVYNTV